MSTQRVAITGNTFPVKDQLKALGAKWDAGRKAWMVAAAKADEAKRLVSGAPVQTPTGKCSKCKGPCKAPYHVCYTCKFPASRSSFGRCGGDDMVTCSHCGKRTPGGDDWCMVCGAADYERGYE